MGNALVKGKNIAAAMLNQFEELRDTLYKFIETRIDLLEVETRGYIEKIILKLVYAALILFAAAILVTFLLLLLAIYLNTLLNSVFAGHLIVAGFFALVLILLVSFREGCLGFIRWVLEKIF